MRGSVWEVVAIGVFVALLPGILTASEGDAGLSGEFAGVVGSLSSVVPLMLVVAAAVTTVGFAFFWGASGGGGF